MILLPFLGILPSRVLEVAFMIKGLALNPSVDLYCFCSFQWKVICLGFRCGEELRTTNLGIHPWYNCILLYSFFEIHFFLFLKSYLFNHLGLCLQIFMSWEHKESWFKGFGKLCKKVIIPLPSFVRCLNLILLHEKSMGRLYMPPTQLLFSPARKQLLKKQSLPHSNP